MRILAACILAIVVLGSPAMASDSSASGHSYVGTNTCKKCHIKQWRSWSETKMASAYEVLKPGERGDAKTAVGLDPNFDYTVLDECVRCHVTGFGEEGGFASIDLTPELVGVGCEMCHGPGGTYTQEQYMSLKNKEYVKSEVVAVGLVDTVSEEQCVTCHNPNSPFVDDDYVFDFDAMKGTGTHESFPLKYAH